ncbi:hypothetical protein Tco_0445958 [Tanacetum coccineum]
MIGQDTTRTVSNSQGNDLNDLLVKLIGQLDNMGPGGGLHSLTHSNITKGMHVSLVPNSTHMAFHANVSPSILSPVQPHVYTSYPHAHSFSPYPYGPFYTQPAQQQVPPPTLAQQHILGSVQAPLAQPTQPPRHMGSNTVLGQATTLSHAFNTTTLQDLASGAWNMDTGASSHLNSSVTSLNIVFNTCILPVRVELDKRGIDFHTILCPWCDNHHETVDLGLVLCDEVQKVWDKVFQWWGLCSPDAFNVKEMVLHGGNSVMSKTSKTRQVLLRCDSTGDLYPVTTPSPIPHAFLVS